MLMTHPGEQFYPEGVHWGDPIARGTLPDLLSTAATEHGARTVIEFRDRPISYAELEALVETAASAFLRAGYGKGSTVALFLGNTPDHPINFFGALKAGARLVHLSPVDGEIALSHKLSDSGARVLVTSNLSALLPTALKLLEKGLLDRLIVCEDDNWGKVQIPQGSIPNDPAVVTFRQFVDGVIKPSQWPLVSHDEIALLQFTGGTTGLAKGAMLSHGNLTSAVSVYEIWDKKARADRSYPIERVICVLPLFHIFALTVVLLGSIRPLVSVTSGGAPLPVEVGKMLERNAGIKLKSGWGMTETCSPGTSHPQEGPDKPGSIGLMLPGIELDVVSLDDPMKVLPAGEVGEIRIRGPNVTKGYWNRPKETAEAFVGDRLLTGDIGYMDADGYFYLSDRKKNMIISAGFNVYPQMIEQAIYTNSAVQEVLVIGIPDEYRGEAAKAFIKLRADAKRFTIEELRDFLTGKLGKHELPAALEFVEELPRTSAGKLSHQELRDRLTKARTE